MFNARHVARASLIIAVVGSAAAVILLVLAEVGVWMANANLHPTPRINALTVGLGFVPVPALAWIVYLWTHTRPTRALDFVVRIAVSCVLLLGAYLCVGIALLGALFVG
jgi:hypothetical protein